MLTIFATSMLAILLPVIVVTAAPTDNDFSAASLIEEAETLFPQLDSKWQGNYQLGLLADLYDRLGDGDKSKKYYDLLVERASGDQSSVINGDYPIEYCETLIRFHSKRKQFAKAREFVLLLAYESQPTYLESFVLCGEAMYGDWEAALDSVEVRTYETMFGKAQLLRQVVIGLTMRGLVDEAEDTARQSFGNADESFAHQAWLLEAIGDQLYKQGEQERAVEFFEASVEVFSRFSTAEQRVELYERKMVAAAAAGELTIEMVEEILAKKNRIQGILQRQSLPLNAVEAAIRFKLFATAEHAITKIDSLEYRASAKQQLAEARARNRDPDQALKEIDANESDLYKVQSCFLIVERLMGANNYQDALRYIGKAKEIMDSTSSKEVSGRFYFYKPTFKRYEAIATSMIEEALILPDDLKLNGRFGYLCQIADRLLPAAK